jgi:hypothetical protein
MSKDPSSRIPLRVAKQQINYYNLRSDGFKESDQKKRGYLITFSSLEEKSDVSVSIHAVKKTFDQSDSQKEYIDPTPETLSNYIKLKNPTTLKKGETALMLQLKFEFDKYKVPRTAQFYLKIQIGKLKYVTNAFSIISHQNQITDKKLTRTSHKKPSSGSSSPSDEDEEKKKSPTKQDEFTKMKQATRTLDLLKSRKEKFERKMQDVDEKIKKVKLEIGEICTDVQTKLQDDK